MLIRHLFTLTSLEPFRSYLQPEIQLQARPISMLAGGRVSASVAAGTAATLWLMKAPIHPQLHNIQGRERLPERKQAQF